MTITIRITMVFIFIWPFTSSLLAWKQRQSHTH